MVDRQGLQPRLDAGHRVQPHQLARGGADIEPRPGSPGRPGSAAGPPGPPDTGWPGHRWWRPDGWQRPPPGRPPPARRSAPGPRPGPAPGSTWTVGLLRFRSLVTSRNPGSWARRARKVWAQSCSSARSVSWSVYWYWALDRLPADADGGRVLREGLEPDHRGELGAQAGDDLIRGQVPLAAGLERDEDQAQVARHPGPAHPDGGHVRRDIRVLEDYVHHLALVRRPWRRRRCPAGPR